MKPPRQGVFWRGDTRGSRGLLTGVAGRRTKMSSNGSGDVIAAVSGGRIEELQAGPADKIAVAGAAPHIDRRAGHFRRSIGKRSLFSVGAVGSQREIFRIPSRTCPQEEMRSDSAGERASRIRMAKVADWVSEPMIDGLWCG